MNIQAVERWIAHALVLATVALLAVQASSLYTTPIHDSYLWWGDESWLMSEYREQMSSGVFRHPDAVGSSLNVGNPFPFTSMWFTSALYGGAAHIFSTYEPINVGRTLTFLLALMLLFRGGWKWRSRSGIPLALALALLVSSRSFFLTSHSARYDILSALAILGFVSYLACDKLSLTRSKSLVLGPLWAAGLLISVHVPLLLALPLAYYLWQRRATLPQIGAVIISAVITLGVLYLIHLATQPSLSGQTNMSENLATIPILRPFSWSVQSSNLVQKFELLREFALPGLALLVVALIGLRDRTRRAGIVICILPMLGWLLFQSAGPSSYLIHFLPLLALGAIIALEAFGERTRFVVAVVAILSLGFGFKDALQAKRIGDTLTAELHASIAEISPDLEATSIVTMNPALSHLRTAGHNARTTHFIELPGNAAPEIAEGALLVFNSALQPGFMWEVTPLRAEITQTQHIMTGRFLDVGRSYFAPLTEDRDTLFLQRVDLNALYARHIR